MKIVVDSTPLIYLNKVGLSWTFQEMKTIIYTVYNEVVVKVKEIGEPDALITEKLINKKIIEVEK